MHTIENLKNSHEAITNDPFDGFVMTSSLKQLTTNLIHIEKEFQNISPDYNIVFQPNNSKNLNIQLLYMEKLICSQNTYYSFLLYGDDKEYTNSQFTDKRNGISREITFSKKPKFYSELIEHNFIKAFLSNEKLLAQQKFSREFNTQLKNDTTTKFKV